MDLHNKISSVLIAGAENPIALPVIRALSDLLPGVPVHLLSRETGTRQSPRYSRFVTTQKYGQYGPGDTLADELKQTVKETKADILLPVTEDFVRLCASAGDELKKMVHLPPLPDPELLDNLVHKRKLHELLNEQGLPQPRTFYVDSLGTDEPASDFFPCLLKPVRGSSGWGISEISSRVELRRKSEKLTKSGVEYILQEVIPGHDTGCSILAVDGVIRAHTIQSVLANRGFSFSTAIRFERNANILEQVQKLVRQTGYSGLAHLDFRLDERDGVPKLTDFNARFWNSIAGSRTAGVDFVELSCLAALGIPFEYPEYQECVYLMGKSTFNHYLKKWLPPFASRNGCPVATDLPDRLRDPLPEIMRLF